MRKRSDDQLLHRQLAGPADALSLLEVFVVPGDIDKSISDISADLAEVPVLGTDGRRTDVFKKIEADSMLSPKDKRLIWTCLAVVRNAFSLLDEQANAQDAGSGYQLNMNWKHTRAELDQVLEAAKLLKLSRLETRDAIIASIFSDSVKTRKNFIIHNIHGAQAASHVLSQLLDLAIEENAQSLKRVVKAIKEHQIAPPEFMARAVAITICNKLNLGRFEESNYHENEDKDNGSRLRGSIASIFAKIKDPLRQKHLCKDLARIAFTPQEKQLLLKVGVEDWWVPYPDRPDALVAHAVIAGDHSINYNHPEGFAKIALIRGPDTEPIFEDPTIHHSLLSALHSFTDSFRVIRPEVQTLAMDGLRRTMSALERVHAIMSQLFRERALTNVQLASSKTQVIAALQSAKAENQDLFLNEQGTLCDKSEAQTGEVVDRVAAILDDWSQVYGEIPFNPNPDAPARLLPFWNTALIYPPRNQHGVAQLDKLTELQLRQFKFASRIRAIAVELLRAEQWVVSSPV
jgi:hypothetical protein